MIRVCCRSEAEASVPRASGEGRKPVRAMFKNSSISGFSAYFVVGILPVALHPHENTWPFIQNPAIEANTTHDFSWLIRRLLVVILTNIRNICASTNHSKIITPFIDNRLRLRTIILAWAVLKPAYRVQIPVFDNSKSAVTRIWSHCTCED